MKLDVDKITHRFFLLLFATDLLLIALHLLHTYTGFFEAASFSIENDRGFGETYQYVKEFWIACLLLVLAASQRSPLHLTWSILFGYLLVDDSFQLHERLGARLSRSLGFPEVLGLRPEDLGELAIGLAAGSVLLALVSFAHFRSPPCERGWSRLLFLLVLAFAGFAWLVDPLHVAVHSPEWRGVLGTVEDGGEMLVMSAMAGFVFSLSRSEAKGGCPESYPGTQANVPTPEHEYEHQSV